MAAPLSDHAARVAEALTALGDARDAETRLLHDARRITAEITHQRTKVQRAQENLQFVLTETHAAAGLT